MIKLEMAFLSELLTKKCRDNLDPEEKRPK